MQEQKPEGHPIGVMAIGGFLGGMMAGGMNVGVLGFVFLCLGTSFGMLAVFGHIRKEVWGHQFATLLGLSTYIPLPLGGIGLILGKSLWSTI